MSLHRHRGQTIFFDMPFLHLPSDSRLTERIRVGGSGQIQQESPNSDDR
jgi:hypothetical protein